MPFSKYTSQDATATKNPATKQAFFNGMNVTHNQYNSKMARDGAVVDIPLPAVYSERA
jgi:hypothetical protein